MLHLQGPRCRKTFIVVHKHRNPENTKFTKLVQIGNFITFELKVIRHEERETQYFYADCFYISPKPRAAPHLQTTGLASAGPESQPSRSDAGTQLTAFSQIPQILSTSGHDVTHTLWSHLPSGVLFWHLWMMHPPHSRVNTCAHVCTQLTHALSRKVLILTKPKGKIYKTKSFRNYITGCLLARIK